MRKIISIVTLITAVVAVSTTANAQVTGNGQSDATVVAPITIVAVNSLSFGNVAVSATAGTVVLAPADGARTATGGVTLPATAGTFTAATFTVGGEGNYTYSIQLPASAVTLTSAGASTTTLTAFTSSPATSGQLTSGTQTLSVGATLNIAGGQAATTYSAPQGFDVVVNYL
jgi:hypothetical protein